MNGFQFEKKIKKLFHKAGFKTSLCKKSGAWFADEDLIIGDIALAQIKYTEKSSFIITTKILSRLWQNAFNYMLKPILIVGMQDDIYVVDYFLAHPNETSIKSTTLHKSGTIVKDNIQGFDLKIIPFDKYIEEIKG